MKQIKAQLDELSFAPRRFASLRAVELAETLGERLGVARATTYRYVGALCDSGSWCRYPVVATCWDHASSNSTAPCSCRSGGSRRRQRRSFS